MQPEQQFREHIWKKYKCEILILHQILQLLDFDIVLLAREVPIEMKNRIYFVNMNAPDLRVHDCKYI